MKEKVGGRMSDFYNSLKGKMHDTLPWRKDDSIPLVRVNNANALSLNREMERLEKFVVDRIGRLKEVVNASEAIVSEETRQSEQLAGSLKAEIAALKAKIEEAEKTSERKDLAHAKNEENLSAKIKNLQDELKKKDEMLATRDNEIKDYKSKMDENVNRIGELELANTKTREQAASHAKRAEDLAKSSWDKISALESRLKDTEDLAHQKESTIKELEQHLAKTQEFESMLQDKQKILTQRDSEITDLRSQLKRFKKGINEISYLFREAEVLTGLEEEEAARDESQQTVEEKPAAVERNIGKITAVVADADAIPEMVSSEIFQRIISELAQAANVIGAVASVIVHQQVKALGESVGKFPRARLPELLEALAQEITDENVQIDFRQRLADSMQFTLN
jgi:chromosome segregation ATPase